MRRDSIVKGGGRMVCDEVGKCVLHILIFKVREYIICCTEDTRGVKHPIGKTR